MNTKTIVLYVFGAAAALALLALVLAMSDCAANDCSDRRVGNESTVGLLADGVAFYEVLYSPYIC